MRIWSSPFKCNYLKNKKYFPSILFHLWNIHQILNISKKTGCHSQCISKLTIVQELIRQLTKKHIVRTSFDTQQVKGSQALVKPSWEHFYHILPSLSGEIHGLLNGLLNTSILFGIVRNCHCLFRCNYLRNKKSFFSFSYPLWNLHQILNIFKRKKIVTANVFPKLTTV